MIEIAAEEAPPERLYAVLVWDRHIVGDGPGGTSHVAAEIQRIGGRVAVVDPTKGLHEDRQSLLQQQWTVRVSHHHTDSLR